VLGLWGYALLDLANTDVTPLKTRVQQTRDKVFPPKYFKGLVEVLEEVISDPKSEFSRSTQGQSMRKSATTLAVVHETRKKSVAGNDVKVDLNA